MPFKEMKEVSQREKFAIYLGGGIGLTILVWVVISVMRSEGLLDWRIALFGVPIAMADWLRRRRKS